MTMSDSESEAAGRATLAAAGSAHVPGLSTSLQERRA